MASGPLPAISTGAVVDGHKIFQTDHGFRSLYRSRPITFNWRSLILSLQNSKYHHQSRDIFGQNHLSLPREAVVRTIETISRSRTRHEWKPCYKDTGAFPHSVEGLEQVTERLDSPADFHRTRPGRSSRQLHRYDRLHSFQTGFSQS